MRQLVAYGGKVFDLRRRLAGVVDTRRAPRTAAGLVAAAVFYTGLVCSRSFESSILAWAEL